MSLHTSIELLDIGLGKGPASLNCLRLSDTSRSCYGTETIAQETSSDVLGSEAILCLIRTFVWELCFKKLLVLCNVL